MSPAPAITVVSICTFLLVLGQWLCEDHDVHELAFFPAPVAGYASNGVFPAPDEWRPVLVFLPNDDDGSWHRALTSPTPVSATWQISHTDPALHGRPENGTISTGAPTAAVVAVVVGGSSWLVLALDAPPRLQCVSVSHPVLLRWELRLAPYLVTLSRASAQLWLHSGIVFLYSDTATSSLFMVVAVNASSGLLMWRSTPPSRGDHVSNWSSNERLVPPLVRKSQPGFAWQPLAELESAVLYVDDGTTRVTVFSRAHGIVQFNKSTGAPEAHQLWQTAPTGTLTVTEPSNHSSSFFQWIAPLPPSSSGPWQWRPAAVRCGADGPLVYLDAAGQLVAYAAKDERRRLWSVSTSAEWALVTEAAAHLATRPATPGRTDGTDLATIVEQGFSPVLLALDSALLVAVGWGSLALVSVGQHTARVAATVDLPAHPLPRGVRVVDVNGDGCADVALLCVDGWHVLVIEQHAGSQLLRVAWLVQLALVAVYLVACRPPKLTGGTPEATGSGRQRPPPAPGRAPYGPPHDDESRHLRRRDN